MPPCYLAALLYDRQRCFAALWETGDVKLPSRIRCCGKEAVPTLFVRLKDMKIDIVSVFPEYFEVPVRQGAGQGAR